MDRTAALLSGRATLPPGGSEFTSSIAAADVDGDGDLDVLLGNYGSPSLVLLNAGDGTFPTSIELPGGSASTNSIAAADMDGDGDLDVLLGNYGSPSLVLLNAGDGTFLTSIELPGGSSDTSSIAAADVDGDGDLDVLLGNYGSPSLVLLNAGDGTLLMSIELPGGSASTNSIAAADVDGDGDLDVLLGINASPSLVLLNVGDGTFLTSIELPGGSSDTSSIAAADVDGDGDLDVLVGNNDRPSVVLLNAGDGTFPTSITLPGRSFGTSSIAAADVDGDGDLDVLLGKYLGGSSLVLLNAGDGTFPTSIELPGSSAGGTKSIAAADADGDGDLDVLLGIDSGGPSRLLLNLVNVGDGTFPTSIALPGSSAGHTSSIAAADVDGDGDLDVLLGNYGSPSLVLLNAGDGTFLMSIELPGGSANTYSIAAADVDGDGDLDVLVGNWGSLSHVLLNAGDGTFPTSVELPGGSEYGSSIAAADVDGDGDLDVLLVNYDSPSLVLLNAGDGTFLTSIELPGVSTSTNSVAAADMDGDGDLDVLLGNYGSPSLVLLNAGDGTLLMSSALPGGSSDTSSIAAADVDGDGDLDVLLGNYGSPSLVLLNAGDGTFLTSIALSGGRSGTSSITYTNSIAAADVDGDGDLDVLLGNYGSPSLVLLNAGDGTFPTSIELGGSANTYSIAAADADGDGDLDVLLGNSGGPSYLLPFIRCSQPGTARSRFGNGCIRCPAPSSRRDDHFDICYECEEHTELDYRGECSSCKPGSDRSVGATECTACPRGKRQGKAGTFCVDCSPGTYAPFNGLFGPTCLHAPPSIPAMIAAVRGVEGRPYEVGLSLIWALACSVALVLVALVFLWRRRRHRHKRMCQLHERSSVSMQGLPLLAPRPLDRLTNSGGGPDMTVSDVRSDDATQLEVQDFSTLTMGRPIGKGGFATVWTARWQGNHLAVKVLDVSSAQQEMAMLQEVAILRRLRHPCICALFGHLRVDQRPALVLEYMAGGSLAAYLFKSRSIHEEASTNVDWRHTTSKRRPSLALDVASAPVAPQALLVPGDNKICFAVQLASGLCFLHSHGILHHDIKTDNALLDANHSVCKLADFGLASLILAKGKNTVTVGGTLRYLAPEVVEDAHRQAREMRDRGDARSVSSSLSLSLGRTLVSFEDRADVYAFALLLWELMHERRAFEELTAHEAFMSARKGIRPELSKTSKGDGIQTLTVECWAQRPEERPSMGAVLERLEMCMQDLSATQSVTRTESSLQESTPSASNYMLRGSPMEMTVIPLRSMLHGTGSR